MTADNRHSEKIKRKDYEKHLRKLQVELCRLQDWVKAEGARVIVIFEGRDAAGKGGTIKAITERVSPRVFRVVALPAPSDREKSQMYLQRYITQFPAAGEMVIFDRSWYNRAGVEYVMNFVDKDQHKRFLQLCPEMEKYIVDGWHQIDQNMARSRSKRTGKAFQRPDRRPDAAMETEPDGPGILSSLVRVLAGARLDAQSHRYQARAVVHRAYRRQAPGKAQLYFTHPCANPVQESRTEESPASRQVDQEQIRRSGSIEG